MTKEVVISEKENIAAIIENGKVVEFFMNEGEQLVGDIILGKVDNIAPSIEAAFIDIGNGKNGFIHLNDLVLSAGKNKTDIKFHLKPKQKLLVQVSKEATSSKGPRLTCSITLPGKYLVLTPYERKIGISKKILDEGEKERLADIAKNICKAGYGIIIRTEAVGQSEKSLKEDLDLLLSRWNEILTQSESSEAPTVLYRDQDLLYRVLRDSVDNNTDKIVVDSPEAKNRSIDLLKSWSDFTNKSVYFSKSNSLANEYNLYHELELILNKKVHLPSGGYLIIENTEALTVIDVNSGTSKSSDNLSQTILQTNKEAAIEIARQLRLRDIGGVIVIDFIDMSDPREQQIIWQLFFNSVKNDKSEPQLGYFSEFGLLELTRHRQRKGLHEILTDKCPTCDGVGRLRNRSHRFDVLSQDSASRRTNLDYNISNLDINENKKQEEKKYIQSPSYTVENRMNKIPNEVKKQKEATQRNQISYFRNENLENDHIVENNNKENEKVFIESKSKDIKVEKPIIEIPKEAEIVIYKAIEDTKVEKEIIKEEINKNENLEKVEVINLLDTKNKDDDFIKPKKRRRTFRTFLPKNKKKVEVL